jgi:drug resistance transporter, bcr/cflA subfamily|nr:multidrug effflux MFS transporter [Bacteroides salyersiae]
MKSFHPKKAVTFATIKKSRKMENRKYNSRRFVLVFAALLSAFGPFMTDLYLPAFPELMEYFGTTTSLIQLSLTFGVIGLAAGQLVIGPLSDKYGRRRPLILSLTVFVVSTLICLLCRDVITFICFRLLQGIAAAGGVVISRSIAVDLYEGKEFTRFFAMLSAVQGLAPIVAPIAGGLLLGITDWRGIFAVLLLIGVAILAAAFRFRESLPEERRQTGSVLATFANFRSVLGNKHFVCYMLIQSFAMGVLFAYISSSPFIFQTEYGLTPVMYSVCFAFNGLAIMTGNLIVPRFGSEERALGIGACCLLIASLVLAVCLMGGWSVVAIEIGFLVLLFCVGMVLPTSTSLALALERKNSGNASAMLGFFQFTFAGLVAPLVGLGEVSVATSWVIVIASCATCGLVGLLLMATSHTFFQNTSYK